MYFVSTVLVFITKEFTVKANDYYLLFSFTNCNLVVFLALQKFVSSLANIISKLTRY